MRVAIVLERLDPARGGAETSALELARCLAALGVEIHFVSGDERPPTDEFVHHSIEPRGATRAARSRAFVRGADSLCRERAFDVVHAITPCLSADVYQPRGGTYVETIRRSVETARSPLGRLAKRLGRSFNTKQRFFLETERELLTRREPPIVAAVSEYVKRQVIEAYGLPQERVRVVFNGVTIEPLLPEEAERERARVRGELGIGKDTPLVLFVAHNFKLKGLAELIRAAGFAEQDADADRCGVAWSLVVVGRDDPRPFAALARRFGVEGRVQFVGAADSIRSMYAAADVLAHPTWYDPCSRVVLEALSLGLPVVTTSLNGAAEVMESGKHGVVIERPDQVERLAAAIAECLSTAMRESASRNAGCMREKLSMMRHARELLDVYNRARGLPEDRGESTGIRRPDDRPVRGSAARTGSRE